MTRAPKPDRFLALGLGQADAAAFVGVSATTFRAMVEDGRMPRPRRVGTRRLWNRREIEAAFDALPAEGEDAAGEANEWDEAPPMLAAE